MFTGSVALPVSADAVIVPPAPTFTVATAKAPVPLVPGISTMPSLLDVAARATMSDTGVDSAEKRRVLIPERMGTRELLAQSKPSCTSVEGIGAVGVMAKTKL